ncbi:MAG: CHAP domain-containing protein [Candidatus Saccharimonadales bacterium]
MNVAYLSFNVLTGGNLKKQIYIVLTTLFLILLLPFMAVFALGEEALAFLAHSPSAKHAETRGFYMGGPVPGNTYAWGNCTYWAFAMRLWDGHPIPTTWGNANTWDERAALDGYEVNQTPAVGSIYQTDGGEWGHVAYVIEVDPVTKDFTISEMNAPNLNVVTERTFSGDTLKSGYYDFIHYKEGEDPWNGLPISTPSLRTGDLSLR